MEKEKKEALTESRRLGITETLLRDAHQSLWATRMRIEHILPMAEALDEAGYHSLEVWGGATFDSCLRYLNEDPWARLVKLKAHIRKTPLQMLLRGQNILGYRHYPDDVLEYFLKKAVENGIDIVRIFDALNDVRNMAAAIRFTKEAGGHAQAAVVYTLSPVHDLESYVRTAQELKDLGADSLCIKDMAGILSPKVAFELVRRLKTEVKLPLQLHTHYSSGMASMTYLKAAEAGVDVIDTALSPLALGSSQPPTEAMVAALSEFGYNTGVDLKKLLPLTHYLQSLKDQYKEVAAPLTVNTEVLITQVPGGMISNLRAQLKQQGMLDKLDAILAEIPRVRADMGYPPLVTPMSQIVGTQAVFNVVTGERYKVKSKEIRDYVRGLYGRPPAPISPQIQALILGEGEEIITGRPADLLEPGLPAAREEIKEYIEKEEDVLTYALFPEYALDFFKKRKQAASRVA